MFTNILESGGRIYYDVIGRGPLSESPSEKELDIPVLFLLHGGPGIDSSGFRMHSLDLQSQAQLVLFDFNGHGRSSGASCEHTLQSAIRDVEELRKYLQIEKIALLGFSYGGYVALGYAIEYPQHLQGLVLMCTAHNYHFIEKSREEFVKRSPSLDQQAVFDRLCAGEIASNSDFIHYFNQLAPLYSDVVEAALEKQEKQKDIKTTWDGVRLGYEASNAAYKARFWRFDYTELLHRISSPVLILAGERDWMCHMSFSQEMADLIPRAELVVLGCGHILPVDAHEVYVERVRNFLSDLVLNQRDEASAVSGYSITLRK